MKISYTYCSPYSGYKGGMVFEYGIDVYIHTYSNCTTKKAYWTIDEFRKRVAKDTWIRVERYATTSNA